MGRRHNQAYIYESRMRAIPPELYPKLAQRASDPFTATNTNPFYVNGRPGEKYISIAYRPTRTTKQSLGAPEFVMRTLAKLAPSEIIAEAGDRPTRHTTGASTATTSHVSPSEKLQPEATEPAHQVSPNRPLATDISTNREVLQRSETTALSTAAKCGKHQEEGNAASFGAFLRHGLSATYWLIPALALGLAILASTINAASSALAVETGIVDLPRCTPLPIAAANSMPHIEASHDEALLLPQDSEAALHEIENHGVLGQLFAALCRVTNQLPCESRRGSYGMETIAVEDNVQALKLIEAMILPAAAYELPMDAAFRQTIRGNLRTVTWANGKLVLSLNDVPSYRRAITDPEDPRRVRAGLSWGRLALSFQEAVVVVEEVQP